MMTTTVHPPAAPLPVQLAALSSRVAVAVGGKLELVRVTGREPLAVLDRIVSQAVKDLAPGEGKLALLLHAKGQFRALFAVLAADGEAWLLPPPGRAEAVVAALARFLALSRCQVQPAAAEFTATVLGPGWEEVAAARGVEVERLRRGGWAKDGDGELTWFGWTFVGLGGAVVMGEGGSGASLLDHLAARGAVAVGEEALEVARLAAGWPAWGAELTDSTLPPEVPVLDELAISYHKGCYTGQETIARMKTYGHPNWQLVRLGQVAGPTTPPTLPARLAAAGGGKGGGRLTSWALHPEGWGMGLGFVHRLAAHERTFHDDEGRTFTPLPAVSGIE